MKYMLLIGFILLIISALIIAYSVSNYHVDVAVLPFERVVDVPEPISFMGAATSSTPLVNHIVTIDGTTFLKLFNYANSHGITVGETIPILLNNGAQSVFWRPEDINSNTVSVNIIQKVKDNPATYTTVKNLAQDIPNDGSFSWSEETKTPNSFVEIECGSTSEECHASILIPLN